MGRMKLATARPLATWLCLVTVLLGGLAPGQSYVLCLGMNGHVEMSRTGVGCDECETPSHEADPGPCSDEAGLTRTAACCPCLDIPIASSGDVFRVESPRIALELSLPMHATLPAYHFDVDGPSPLLRLALHDPPDPSRFILPQLRSVILLV
jgi:hypothetical protein